MKTDIDFAAPLEITFPLDGKDITVRPAGVAQIARMLADVRPLLDDIVALGPDVAARMSAGDEVTPQDLALLLDVLGDHGTLPQRLVALATGLDEAWVGALLPDRFAYLFALVVQVNADFFGKALPVFKFSGGAISKALDLVRASKPGAATTAPTSPTPGPSSSTS